MKNSIFLLLITLTSCYTEKIVNLKAIQYSQRHKIDNSWSNFTDFDSCMTLIDLKKTGRLFWKKSSITIMEKDTTHLNVIGNAIETSDTLGHEIMLLDCRNKQNKPCDVVLVNHDSYVDMILTYPTQSFYYKLVMK